VFEDTDWNKQQVAAAGQGITRMLACCKGILKEKKRSLSLQCSVLAFFKSSSGTRASPPVLLDIAHDDLHDQPAVKEEVPHLYNGIFLSYFLFFAYFCVIKSISWSQQIVWNQTLYFSIAFKGKPA
jgi:hypothetical protein